MNGRLFQTLMFLAPGTTPAAWGDQIENPAASGSPAVGGGGGGTYASVNGFPFQGNLYLVDGVLNVEPQNAYINIATPFADIAEKKMETSVPTAEYGIVGGAVVNLTTRSGTNRFHGQLFEYLRNTNLNAHDYFSDLNPPYPLQSVWRGIRRSDHPGQAVLLRGHADHSPTCGGIGTFNRADGGDANGGSFGVWLVDYQHGCMPDDCQCQ
ncbi:MAG TPA: hypothetical protein VK670_15935, partial [Silvibacterium sp.]|nr:hypothetical protein [Silvibacterium sp.]